MSADAQANDAHAVGAGENHAAPGDVLTAAGVVPQVDRFLPAAVSCPAGSAPGPAASARTRQHLAEVVVWSIRKTSCTFNLDAERALGELAVEGLAGTG